MGIEVVSNNGSFVCGDQTMPRFGGKSEAENVRERQ